MQDCSKYDTMLSAYLDGELGEAELGELEEHLGSCRECRKYLALLKSVKEGLKEDLPDPPETLREGIAYKLSLETRRQKLYFGAFGRWTAIAAVLCLVLFGVLRLTGSGLSGAEKAVPAEGAGRYNASFKSSSGGASADYGSQESAREPAEAMQAAPAGAPRAAIAAGGASADDAGNSFADGAAEEESAPTAANDTAAPPIEAAAAPPPEAAAAPDAVWEAPTSYMTDTLRGSQAGLLAVKEGDYHSVLVFYDALPEDVSTENWAMQTPREGELRRWLVSAEELQGLMESGSCDEVYFGDGLAGQGLVLLIAVEEE